MPKYIEVPDNFIIEEPIQNGLGTVGVNRIDLSFAPAADVAPVVRCQDCEYFGHLIAEEKHACKNYQLPYCKPDDFCSYGKRVKKD